MKHPCDPAQLPGLLPAHHDCYLKRTCGGRLFNFRGVNARSLRYFNFCVCTFLCRVQVRWIIINEQTKRKKFAPIGQVHESPRSWRHVTAGVCVRLLVGDYWRETHELFLFAFRGDEGVLWTVWLSEEVSSTICKLSSHSDRTDRLTVDTPPSVMNWSMLSVICGVCTDSKDGYNWNVSNLEWLLMRNTFHHRCQFSSSFLLTPPLCFRLVARRCWRCCRSEVCLIVSFVLHQDKETGFHRGFCWVGFTSEEGLNNALQKEPHVLEGAKVRGKWCQWSGKALWVLESSLTHCSRG